MEEKGLLISRKSLSVPEALAILQAPPNNVIAKPPVKPNVNDVFLFKAEESCKEGGSPCMAGLYSLLVILNNVSNAIVLKFHLHAPLVTGRRNTVSEMHDNLAGFTKIMLYEIIHSVYRMMLSVQRVNCTRDRPQRL